MNTLKRTFTLMLCLALMIVCFAGCHEKGEIAVTIGDIEFTSGYYACALVNADAEARTTVEEQLSEEGDLPEEIEYWDHKIDDKDYVEWVENTALETLKDLASIKTLCAEANVTLDEDALATAKENSEYLWDTLGYSNLMEQNGVSKETFFAYMEDSFLVDEYFEHLYGKGGEKEISAEELTKELAATYILVNKIEVSFSSLSETEITDKKNQIISYETALKDGSKTFEEIYLEYYKISAEDHKHEDAEDGELMPQDRHATVLTEDSTHFETAKTMATDDVKIITLEENAGIVLLIKKDITSDPYYLDSYDSTLRDAVAGETFEDDITKYGESLECTVDDFSTGQFSVEDIVYPEATY